MKTIESEIVIAKANPEDIPDVSELFDQYRVFYGQSSNIQAAANFISDRMTKNESVIFWARKANKPVGFVQLYPSFSSVSMKKVWVLNDLYVEEIARRHGIAELLMNTAKEFANKTEAKGITLCTAVINTPAQKLYEKLGYIKNETYYYYYLYF
ncbi:MAG TPA: GNAT family N-acetyltransferase [Bacillota bacterium]|nr:GNAT family N-acetyltransferase [Bacillota bacterium]